MSAYVGEGDGAKAGSLCHPREKIGEDPAEVAVQFEDDGRLLRCRGDGDDGARLGLRALGVARFRDYRRHPSSGRAREF